MAFSLIELVIAIAVLSVGLVGAMRVFPVGLRASQRAQQSSRATMAAQRTIESLKLTPWAGLTDGEQTDQQDGFEVTTRLGTPSVEGVVDAGRLKTVEVAIRWHEAGRPRELVLLTYLRRDTLGGE